MRIQSSLNNIFDQYDVEENRVTSAFLQTLAGNPALLRSFLGTYLRIPLKKNAQVAISAQKAPFAEGDIEKERAKVEGIPDGWLVIDEEIAVVFESKVTRGAVRRKQLLGHLKRIRGYSRKYLCVITPDEASPLADLNIRGADLAWVSWRQVYELVDKTEDGQAVARYLRDQLKEYLAMKEDLVGFQGVDYPSGEFNPREAKTILKNLIREIKADVLRTYPRLRYERKSYSQDVHPYTVYQRSTWTYLGADENFTKDMHLTLWLTETHMGMGVTVPNNAGARWRRLRRICRDGRLFDSFVEKLNELRRQLPNLYLEFVHRHYVRKRDGIIDGILEMDLDTVKGSKSVKVNERWLSLLRELIRNKTGYNGQLMVRTRYFYKDHSTIRTAIFKAEVIKTARRFSDVYHFLQDA